ncbi:MAG: hypothetical protein AB1921_08380 [Thermodesulfobacteriota bacterium]
MAEMVAFLNRHHHDLVVPFLCTLDAVLFSVLAVAIKRGFCEWTGWGRKRDTERGL